MQSGIQKSKLCLAGPYQLECSVRDAMTNVPRASSLVENLNSRLRNYFFLRHHIGNGYLDLLRFYLNHHRFDRSDRDERAIETNERSRRTGRQKSRGTLAWTEPRPLVRTTRIPTFPAKLRIHLSTTATITRTQKQRPPSLNCYPKRAVFEPGQKKNAARSQIEFSDRFLGPQEDQRHPRICRSSK